MTTYDSCDRAWVVCNRYMDVVIDFRPQEVFSNSTMNMQVNYHMVIGNIFHIKWVSLKRD